MDDMGSTATSAIADPFSRRKIKFELTGTAQEFALDNFEIDEAMSQCFQISVSLLSRDPVKPEDVIGKPCLLTMGGFGTERYFHGIISMFTSNGEKDKKFSYNAVALPALSFLALNRDCRIFQRMTTVQVTKELLKKNGIAEKDYQFMNMNESEYDLRRHCVQYRESDLNIMSRLLEEEGIWYCFEHDEDGHKLIIGDKNIACDFIEGDDVLPFNSGGMATRVESVSALSMNQQVVPGKVTQQSHNFKKSRSNLKIETEVQDEINDYEIYDYSCDYGDENVGKRLANVRLEESRVRQYVASGISNCSRFAPGFTFTLTGHSEKAMNQSYLILSVQHSAEQSGRGGDYNYRNTFTVIPETVTYRPPRRAKRTYIRGLQSATVVGPEKGEIYSDEYGRVNVQFHWDRLGKKDENSSCSIRVAQPWAGQGRGAIFIPRVGDEVIVNFMDGNPDLPMIVGCTYNSKNTPFFDTKTKNTISSIKTRSTGKSDGFNELRFDDKAGSEELFMHAQKDMNIKIRSCKSESVGGSKTSSVGADKTVTVKGKSSNTANEIEITSDTTIKISAASEITLVCGGSTIKIAPDGVTIVGSMIKLNP